MPDFFGCLMEKFDSITHFLESGEFEYRVFDMGRKVTPISSDDFDEIENQEVLYPYPLQQKAWLALLFWSNDNSSKEKQEPVIWFLQFPIDEMGYLKQDARDGFLIGLLEQAGKNIQSKLSGGLVSDELNESPYAFKPLEDRLALFHAFATRALGQSPSRYYDATREYLSGSLGFGQWQFLGLQGIADVVVRLDQDDNEKILAKAISSMPDTPLEVFCRALENMTLGESLSEALEQKIMSLIKSEAIIEPLFLSMLMRASSGMGSKNQRERVLLAVLKSNAGKDVEILVAISGRAWNDLFSEKILSLFLLNLSNQDQKAFDAILKDLMMLPKLRSRIVRKLDNLHDLPKLAHRANEFLKQFKI